MNTCDGAIAYVDEQLGSVYDALEARGLIDHTVVIIASDHGESWGEHGLIDQAGSLYLPQLHVPLFISYPGRLRENLRIGTAVTLRDLIATVLDIFGLQESAIPGNSLMTLFTQSTPPAYGSVLLAELDVTPANVSLWAPVRRGNIQTLFEGDLHYIRNGDGVEELYDMSLDPEEIQDLGVADQQPTLNRLPALLDSVRRPGGGAAQGELRAGASVTPRGVR